MREISILWLRDQLNKMTTEPVVLVNDQDQPIGTAEKFAVHQAETPLHQAFSCFLFQSDGSLILQQRAAVKKTWPLVWSNTCCGHPLPSESRTDAVCRRLNFELGIPTDTLPEIHCFLPDYRYQSTFLGVMENEICPVFVGLYDEDLTPNPDEVKATKIIDWQEFITALFDPKNTDYDHLSVWCREESVLLHQSEAFRDWWKQNIVSMS